MTMRKTNSLAEAMCMSQEELCRDDFIFFLDQQANSNLTKLCLSSSIGDACADLRPYIKAGETLTSILLNSRNPSIDYADEHGGLTQLCLEDIWKLAKLEWHGNTSAPIDNGIYQYDMSSKTWVMVTTDWVQPAIDQVQNNLNTYITQNNQRVLNLETRVSNLEGRMNDAESDIQDLKNKDADLQLQIDELNSGETESTLHTLFRLYRTWSASDGNQVVGSSWPMPVFNANVRYGSASPDITYDYANNAITIRNTSTYNYMIEASSQTSLGENNGSNGIAFVYAQITNGGETLGETGGAYVLSYDIQTTARGTILAPGATVTMYFQARYGSGQPFGATTGTIRYDIEVPGDTTRIQSFFEVRVTGTTLQPVTGA